MSLESVTDEKSSNLIYFYFHPPQKDFKASLLQLRRILADFQLYQGYRLGFFDFKPNHIKRLHTTAE